MDPTTKTQIAGALYTVGVPAASVIAFGLIGLFTRRGQDNHLPLALGLAFGVAGAYVGIAGMPSWPIGDTGAWLPVLVIGAALVFAVLDRGAERQSLGRVLPFVLAALGGTLYLTLSPSIGQAWSGPEALALNLGVPAALGLVVWLGVDRAATRAPSAAIFAALTIASIGAAVTVLLGASAKYAQLLGAVAAASGFATLVTWRWPRLGAGHASVAVLLVAHVAILAYTHHYAYPGLPAWSMALLAVAPVAVIAAAPIGRTLPAIAVASLVALAPAASAAWLAKSDADARAAAAEQESTEGYPEGYVPPSY